MENTVYCQRCGMPLTKPEEYGTNRDGSKNGDYCQYCFVNGAFAGNATMEEMIEICIPYVLNGQPYHSAEEARSAMREYFPTLKRWKQG